MNEEGTVTNGGCSRNKTVAHGVIVSSSPMADNAAIPAPNSKMST